jgi:hypothetical protein
MDYANLVIHYLLVALHAMMIKIVYNVELDCISHQANVPYVEVIV